MRTAQVSQQTRPLCMQTIVVDRIKQYHGTIPDVENDDKDASPPP